MDAEKTKKKQKYKYYGTNIITKYIKEIKFYHKLKSFFKCSYHSNANSGVSALSSY